MPIVSGSITGLGALVDVMLGVDSGTRRRLEAQGLKVPDPIAVKVLIDTGATISGFATELMKDLGLLPIDTIPILTPSTPYTAPHECDVFHASLALVANGVAHEFPECRVLAAEGWHPADGIHGLIGRDILARCNMLYLGTERKFTLAF